ncbi:hypothetical protein ACHAWX_006792, partial [Stephanocyclus meneghinianus]
AFVVYANFKSHTGVVLTLGNGILIGISCKQKFNTKSSTEGKLVAVDDSLEQIIWTNYFIDSLRYQINCTVVCQVNQSDILLEKNGKDFNNCQTFNINISYFFIHTEKSQVSLRLSAVPLEICWLITSPSLFRVRHFISFDHRS